MSLTASRLQLEERRIELEHMKWERNFQWEMRKEEEEKLIQYELERSRERPSLTEVVAGTMLNNLLAELSKSSSPPGAPSVAIKQEWLDNINFTSTGGNAGLLRQKELPWPVLLQEDRFAATRAEAEDIAADVQVEFAELPAVVDMLAARQSGAPLVHEAWGDNVVLETRVDADLAAIRASAPIVVRRSLRTARQCMSPMEGRGVVAVWDRRLAALARRAETRRRVER